MNRNTNQHYQKKTDSRFFFSEYCRVQEEPENSGALEFVLKKVEEVVDGIEESLLNEEDSDLLFENGRGPNRFYNGQFFF